MQIATNVLILSIYIDFQSFTAMSVIQRSIMMTVRTISFFVY